MKRLLLACAILLCLGSLIAGSLRLSNSIGQDRGVWTGEGAFRLALLPNQTQLYGPDGLVWTKQTFDEEGRQVQVTRYADGKPDLVEVYQDGLLMQMQSGSAVVYYHYATDGLLSQLTTLIGGQLESARIYSYAGGSLSSILTVTPGQSNLRTFGMLKELAYFSFYDQDGGQLFTTLDNGRTIAEYWVGEEKAEEISVVTYEDGSFSLIRKKPEGEILERYDAQGLLVSSKTPSYLTEYRYNESRDLTEQRITEMDGRVMIKMYESGSLVSAIEEIQGQSVKHTRYNEDGSSIQTLYSEGKPYADITYAVDGKRVLSIVYY